MFLRYGKLKDQSSDSAGSTDAPVDESGNACLAPLLLVTVLRQLTMLCEYSEDLVGQQEYGNDDWL